MFRRCGRFTATLEADRPTLMSSRNLIRTMTLLCRWRRSKRTGPSAYLDDGIGFSLVITRLATLQPLSPLRSGYPHEQLVRILGYAQRKYPNKKELSFVEFRNLPDQYLLPAAQLPVELRELELVAYVVYGVPPLSADRLLTPGLLRLRSRRPAPCPPLRPRATPRHC